MHVCKLLFPFILMSIDQANKTMSIFINHSKINRDENLLQLKPRRWKNLKSIERVKKKMSIQLNYLRKGKKSYAVYGSIKATW